MATTSIRTFDLAKEYGVDTSRDKILKDLGYTYTQAAGAFKALIPWLESQGWSQAEVLNLYEFNAAWNDAFLRGCGYFSENPVYSNLTGARLNIIAPHGAFRVNYPCLFNQGNYQGQGAGNYSGASGQSTGGTGIYIDHGSWMTARSPERFCLKSITWGLESGYAECFTVSGFRFEGGKTGSVHDPSYISAGMGIWDSGEASKVESCYAFGFNSYGFMNVRGTPSRFDQCSAFSNGIFGFGLIGNDLSTVTITGPSGDDNGALIGVRSGYGRPGGATVTVIGAKSESGKRTPYRKQKLFDGQGAGNWTITGAWVHAIDGPECVIACDFQTYNGQIDVSGLRHDGYSVALKLTSNGATTTYASPGNVTPYSFIAKETGVVFQSRVLTPSVGTPPVTPPVEPPVTPPATGLPVTIPAHTNTNKDAREALDIAGVKKVTFYGLKWNGPNNPASYPFLLGIGSNGGIQLNAGANFGQLLATNVAGAVTFSQSKLTAGSTTTLTITFAQAQTIADLYNPDQRSDAFLGSFTSAKFE